MVRQEDEERVGELEGARKLRHDLEQAVQELQEDGRALFGQTRVVLAVAVAICEGINRESHTDRPTLSTTIIQSGRCATACTLELVTEGAPLFLDQRGDALEGAEVRVQQHLRQRTHLRGPVPVKITDSHVDEGQAKMNLSSENKGLRHAPSV